MKLAPELHPTLLKLAALDLALSANETELPEATTLNTLKETRAAQRNDAALSSMRNHDVVMQAKYIDADLAKLNRREKATKAALGAIADPGERKDLEKDLKTVERRRKELIAERESVERRIAATELNTQAAGEINDELEAQIAAATRALEAAEESLAAKRRADEAERAHLASLLPAEVLAEYDAQRVENGVGAAKFAGRTCGGCFIRLAPMGVDLVQRAPQDVLPQCPECGTYLVRI